MVDAVSLIASRNGYKNVSSPLSFAFVHVLDFICPPLPPTVADRSSLLAAGRLSKDDIERMVRDAEKYKSDDESQRERIQSKNALESYAYNMKQTVEDEKLKDKLSEDDRKKITEKCNEVIGWLDANQVSRPSSRRSPVLLP